MCSLSTWRHASLSLKTVELMLILFCRNWTSQDFYALRGGRVWNRILTVSVDFQTAAGCSRERNYRYTVTFNATRIGCLADAAQAAATSSSRRLQRKTRAVAVLQRCPPNIWLFRPHLEEGNAISAHYFDQ